MNLTCSYVQKYLPFEITKIIINEFCGFEDVNRSIDRGYCAGLNGLWEVCDRLQHPDIDNAFLGACNTDEMDIICLMVEKGAFSIEHILRTEIISEEVKTYLTRCCLKNKKYHLYDSLYNFRWGRNNPNPKKFLLSLITCDTDWNIVLTASCWCDYQWARIAIDQGATQCYTCNESLQYHKIKFCYQGMWTRMKIRWFQCFYSTAIVIFSSTLFCCVLDCVSHSISDSIFDSIFDSILHWFYRCLVLSLLLSFYDAYRSSYQFEAMKCGHRINTQLWV